MRRTAVQRAGSHWCESCPHDSAKWTSELQDESLGKIQASNLSREAPVTGPGYNSHHERTRNE